MIAEARIIAGGLMVAAVIGGLWHYQHLRAQVAEQREAIATLETERDEAREAEQRAAAALADKVATDRELARRLATLTSSLGDLRRDDPDAARWLDAPLPAGLGRLRDGTTPAPAAPAGGAGRAGDTDDVRPPPAD